MSRFAVFRSWFLKFDGPLGFLKLVFLGRDFDCCLLVVPGYNEVQGWIFTTQPGWGNIPVRPGAAMIIYKE